MGAWSEGDVLKGHTYFVVDILQKENDIGNNM